MVAAPTWVSIGCNHLDPPGRTTHGDLLAGMHVVTCTRASAFGQSFRGCATLDRSRRSHGGSPHLSRSADDEDGKVGIVTAQALEQSVLESKDKDQLLAIAKALGLKASARNKKAEIIDQILTTTGSESPATVRRRRCPPARRAHPARPRRRRFELVESGTSSRSASANPLNGRTSATTGGPGYAGARRGSARRLGARGRRHRRRAAGSAVTWFEAGANRSTATNRLPVRPVRDPVGR